jgi:hypothetical protein
MILSKPELITSLQNEVRILLHLASKIDRAKLDYRPSPKQRSTIELLKYLSIMGPGLVEAAKAGSFDRTRWTAVEQTAAARDFDQTLAAIASHADAYATLLSGMSDADFAGEIEVFGSKNHARRVHRQPCLVRMRGLPHAAVPVPQGARPRRAEHDEPLGRRGRAGFVIVNTKPFLADERRHRASASYDPAWPLPPARACFASRSS